MTGTLTPPKSMVEVAIGPADRYAGFNPIEYLREYYADVGEENAFLLHFYHDVFATLPEGLSFLEFGGGPTIYQLLSASRKTTEIVFTDYLPDNLQEVARWISERAHTDTWQKFAAAVALLEQGDPGAAHAVQERTRAAISELRRCNALAQPALAAGGRTHFDVVSSVFCLECISSERADFLFALNNAADFVAPGGSLLLTLLKNSHEYKVGERTFPAFPVDAASLTEILTAIGFHIAELREAPAEQSQGYEGLIAVHARKRRPGE